MEAATEFERKLLDLPAVDRERLAILAWESLAEDPKVAADSRIDPEGIRLAETRDSEIESGKAQIIDEREFNRLTGGER